MKIAKKNEYVHKINWKIFSLRSSITSLLYIYLQMNIEVTTVYHLVIPNNFLNQKWWCQWPETKMSMNNIRVKDSWRWNEQAYIEIIKKCKIQFGVLVQYLFVSSINQNTCYFSHYSNFFHNHLLAVFEVAATGRFVLFVNPSLWIIIYCFCNYFTLFFSSTYCLRFCNYFFLICCLSFCL